jgi:DNA polymerase
MSKSESLVLNSVPPHLPLSGKSPLAFVGEAPGADEIRKGEPFVGKAGGEFNRWLRHSGLTRSEHLISNVFKYKPVQNKIDTFFFKKKVYAKLKEEYGWGPSVLPYNSTHGYVIPERVDDIHKLREELRAAKTEVVIGMGATALWAFTGLTKITQHRGTVFRSEYFDNIKFVPTFHPSYIMRGNFDSRIFVMADIRKALAEVGHEEIHHTTREIWTEPRLIDLYKFRDEFIAPLPDSSEIAIDIETGHDQITCVGLAPSNDRAIVCPFWDDSASDKSYWTYPKAEVEAWLWLKGILENPRYKFVAHNGSYDFIWLKERMGITVSTPYTDTMHMHHAMQPELPKALGVLGSLYTNESSWKHLVSHSIEQRGNKRDE